MDAELCTYIWFGVLFIGYQGKRGLDIVETGWYTSYKGVTNAYNKVQ